MAFSRIRSPGAWTDNSVVTPAEFEALDDHQSKAIDGAAGGTYGPSAPIIIGNAGLRLQDAGLDVISGGILVLAGDCIFHEKLHVYLEFRAFATARVDGLADFYAQATFHDAAVFSGTLTEVTGAFKTDAANVANGGITIGAGSFVVGSGTSANQIAQEVVLTGAGRVLERTTLTTMDATATLGVLDTDAIVVNGNNTGVVDVRLKEAGASVGSKIAVLNGSGFAVTVKRDFTGTTIATIAAGSLIKATRADFQYLNNGVATQWMAP